MFSQTVEYALRAAVAIGCQPDRPLRTRDISATAQIPADYLFKVLQALAKAGIVRTTRGVNGGVQFVQPPEKVSILAVITAIEPLPRIRKCPLNLKEHSGKLCPLHRRMDKAIEGVEEVFREVTVADLVKESGNAGPFCSETPAPKRRRTKKLLRTDKERKNI